MGYSAGSAGAPPGREDSRILFIVFRYLPLMGGVETQSASLAEALAASGEGVDVLTTTVPGEPSVEERAGVRVFRRIRTVPVRGLWAGSHLVGALRHLILHRRRYRLVLCYQMQSFYNPAALLWGRFRRRPVVVVGGCGGDFGDLRTLEGMAAGRWLLAVVKKASAFIALSGEMREEMAAAGLPAERIVIIPNGVDTAFFTPLPDGPSGEELVFAGRLAPQKGLPVLVEALARLAPSRPGLTLRLLGEGPDEAALKRQVLESGLQDRVRFEGAVDPARVAAAFALAAVVVQPSLEEGLSVSLLEAMATEAAVVTTDIAANRAVLDDGTQGLLVAPKDPEALAGAVARLLDDRDLARRLGRAARRRVEESYSIGAVAQRYGGLFSELSGLGGRA